MAQQTALVTLAPDDSIDGIIAQVKKAGVTHVDLLMPESVTVLQSRKACDRLRETANRDGIDLTLYTDDPKIVSAAQKCQLMVVELDESALAPAGSRPPPTSGPPAPRPAQPAAAAPVAASAAPPPPKRTFEEDFLASLEEMPAAPSPTGGSPTANLRGAETIAITQPSFADRAPEDDWADALDSLSVASIGGEEALRDHQQARGVSDDSWDFDAFNDLSDVMSGDKAGATAAPPARPRIRPEDIELSSEDLNRQRPKNKRAKPEKGKSEKGKRDGEAAAAPRPLIRWIGLALLIGLLTYAAWYFLLRADPAMITVRPPLAASNVYPDLRINFQAVEVSDQTSTAIQGRVVQVPVSVTVEGQVLTATAQPDQTASGAVLLANRNPQPYTLPVNARLRTFNPAGEEVVFLTTQEVAVPAAVSDFTGTQFGRASVPVIASGAGERYNLPANTDAAWTVEGYEGVVSAVNSEPIGGGTNILKKIPTEADILPLLGQAVPQFKQAVPGALQSALQSGEVLADVEFAPRIDELAQNPDLYDIQTQPVEGVDGGFRLVLTAQFRGFAVPANFRDQINRALPNALRLADANFNAETTGIASYTLSLGDDPNANLLLATVGTAPKSGGVDPATLKEISDSLKGKTRNEALDLLEAYQRRGLIGEIVTFPDLESFDEVKVEVQQ